MLQDMAAACLHRSDVLPLTPQIMHTYRICKQPLTQSETALFSLFLNPEAIGNNSDASSQVETSLDAPAKRVKRTPEERMRLQIEVEAATKRMKENYEKMGGGPWSPGTLAAQEGRDHRRALAEENRKKQEAFLAAPPRQRVLGLAFCVNRLEEIRRFAGNAKLQDFTDGFERDVREEEISHLFRRFRCDNGENDPPYFCVSAAILGRLTYTFKEEYIARDKARKTFTELGLHVDEIKELAKESMSQDANSIRMQTATLIDKNKRILLESHDRLEANLATVRARMKERLQDASKAFTDAYEEVLNQQLKVVMDSTITEDTLNQEMEHAATAHRDSIQKMTAIPPLFVDDTRLQLQIRVAAAEEKAEELQREHHAIKGKDFEGKISSLQVELDGLKLKLDTAKGELESLKRKRADSISPQRAITSILTQQHLHPQNRTFPLPLLNRPPKRRGTGKLGGMQLNHQVCLQRYLPLLSTGTV
jgi:hypothetical protein